jgi:hypothetical protein
MSLKIVDNSFHSQYFNVSENDRIPFYFNKKSGQFDSDIFSKKLSFNSLVYDVFRQADQVPSHFNIQKMYKRDDKAIMIDRKTQLPKLIFDQIPLVCLENIMIGLYEQKFSEKQHLFLFEEGSKSQFIIYYVRKGTQKIKLNDQTVNAEQLIFMRKNIPGQPDKPVFELNLCDNSIPVRVASLSKRWELNLYKMGKEEKQRYDRTQNFLNIAKMKIKNHHTDSPKSIEIIKYTFNNRKFSFDYKNVHKLQNLNNNTLVKQFIESTYADYSRSGYGISKMDYYGSHKNLQITDTAKGYVIFISDRNTCSQIRASRISITDCQYITYKTTRTISKYDFISSISNKYGDVSCIAVKNEMYLDLESNDYALGFPGTQEKINCNEAASYYVKNSENLKNMKLINSDCYQGIREFCGKVTLTLSYNKKIDFKSAEIKEYAAKYLANIIDHESSFDINKLSNSLVRKKNGYELYIPKYEITNYKKEVINNKCEKAKRQYSDTVFTIYKLIPDYQDFQCTLYGKSSVPQGMVRYEDTIFLTNPELQFFRDSIVTDGPYWIFTTVPEVKHICK